jgi:hypothetical protein
MHTAEFRPLCSPTITHLAAMCAIAYLYDFLLREKILTLL